MHFGAILLLLTALATVVLAQPNQPKKANKIVDPFGLGYPNPFPSMKNHVKASIKGLNQPYNRFFKTESENAKPNPPAEATAKPAKAAPKFGGGSGSERAGKASKVASKAPKAE